MNLEEHPRYCVSCPEASPAFIHVLRRDFVYRLLCTDCLLKENRQLFCAVCYKLFNGLQEARITCRNCTSAVHVDCCPSPPSSSAASSSSAPPTSTYTCPLCSDPNLILYPKVKAEEEPDVPLEIDSARALVAACRIAVTSTKDAATQLKEEAMKKISLAQMTKFKAIKALENLHDLVIRQKPSENLTPTKRKIDDV